MTPSQHVFTLEKHVLYSKATCTIQKSDFYPSFETLTSVSITLNDGTSVSTETIILLKRPMNAQIALYIVAVCLKYRFKENSIMVSNEYTFQ